MIGNRLGEREGANEGERADRAPNKERARVEPGSVHVEGKGR